MSVGIAANHGGFELKQPSGAAILRRRIEHAIAAVVNGLTLSGLRAYGSSFFVFSDYARPAMRLSALSGWKRSALRRR